MLNVHRAERGAEGRGRRISTESTTTMHDSLDEAMEERRSGTREGGQEALKDEKRLQ